MSTNVKQFVVHQISLNEQGKLVFNPRASCFSVTPAIIELASSIHSGFNAKPGKSVGGFGEQLDPTFRVLTEDMISEKLAFYDYSIKASERLLQSILDESMLETGYVVFSLYEYLATDFLMIAMLDTKESVSVTSELELAQNKYLELSKMQIAVKIDLTDLNINPDEFRYISFIKGRMGRKISDFFMNFVGCEEKVDVKQQNKQFVQQLDSYLAQQSLDADEKHQYRDSVSSYYKDKASLGEEVTIQEIDKILPKEEHNDASFSSFNKSLETPLEPRFQADKSMLNAMNKFSGSGGGVSISFDKNLLGSRVEYDVVNDTLTIQGIPPNLKDQLTRHNQGNS